MIETVPTPAPNQRRKAHENEEGYVLNHTGRWVKKTGKRGKYITNL